jgi:hypothetical protein
MYEAATVFTDWLIDASTVACMYTGLGPTADAVHSSAHSAILIITYCSQHFIDQTIVDHSIQAASTD